MKGLTASFSTTGVGARGTSKANGYVLITPNAQHGAAHNCEYHLVAEILLRGFHVLCKCYPAMQADKGRHSRGEGGLAQALRTKGGRGGEGGDAREADNQASQRSASAVPEASPLGRSPSRKFVSANHLLNFRHDKSGVRLCRCSCAVCCLSHCQIPVSFTYHWLLPPSLDHYSAQSPEVL